MMDFGTGMMGGGFSIIFWIIIIGVVYFFFKEYNNRSDHYRHNNYKNDMNNPEELAKQRYAKGEISKEELNEILDNLNN